MFSLVHTVKILNFPMNKPKYLYRYTCKILIHLGQKNQKYIILKYFYNDKSKSFKEIYQVFSSSKHLSSLQQTTIILCCRENIVLENRLFFVMSTHKD